MSTERWPAGYGLIELRETDSTNSEASRWLPELTGPTWITAKHQTKARGRGGHRWEMPEGNLAATLVLPHDKPETAAQFSFVAALALADACLEATDRRGAYALKWPNDVLLNSGKFAGILLEGLGHKASFTHLAIGIGVNLFAAPKAEDLLPGAVQPVSLREETGVEVAPSDFMPYLARSFEAWRSRHENEGFGVVREAWLARAARLGEVIRARTSKDELHGVFETLDEQGHLVLKTDTGPVTLPAADIFF